MGPAAAIAGPEHGPARCAPRPFASCAHADYTLGSLGAADFRGADLRGSVFNGAWLRGASFAGADLRGADLRGTTLTAASLRGARLRGANLADANLRFARVRNRQLRAAYLCRTERPGGSVAMRDCDRSAPLQPPPPHARVSAAVARAAARPRLVPRARPEPATPRRAQPSVSLARALGAGAAGARAKAAPRRHRGARLRVRVVGPGSVKASAGRLACPGTCSARYRVGDRVVLRARPQRGASFAGWSGACRGTGTCAIRLRARRYRVTATFKTGAPCPVPQSLDSDGDGLPDCMELSGWALTVRTPQDLSAGDSTSLRVSSDPQKPDTDGDGVPDGVEFARNSNPRATDTDLDGLSDEEEIVKWRTLAADADSDGDSRPPDGGPRDPRLFDGNEVRDLHTNPHNPDTDGDSISDYLEVVREGTNPRIADLPNVSLVAVPGLSNPQLELDYTVEDTTGTESESAQSTEITSGSETSTETSVETTNETTNEYQAGEKCGFSADEIGCTESFKYTRTETESVTNGTTSEFSNSQETSRAAEEVAQRSAERKVTLEPTGCMQVVLRLENTGPVSVSVGNLQVLALTQSPENRTDSELLAALLPIQGRVQASTCPATEVGFGPVELPPGGSADVAFGQLVNSRVLLKYMSNPTPITYQLGPITMHGTNLAGQDADFLGGVAQEVSNHTARVEVDFGDGTIREYNVATGFSYAPDGAREGLTLGDVLGPELADLDPQYTSASPSAVRALRNPDTGDVVANGSGVVGGAWNLFGDAQGIGDGTTNWSDVVLRPGDTVSLSFQRDADQDGLPDSYEGLIGTNPQSQDTDGDGLGDAFEARTGWTVPFARGNQSSYHVFPSPISCDGDGDGSPDGPGPGNATFGPCPTGQGPESTRLTDPTLADTNGDGLLDGDQSQDDALRAVPFGGRLPQLIRVWGGPGDFGDARPIGIAVDTNQPLVDENGATAPIDSYVIAREPNAAGDDLVFKFNGNPRVVAPYRALGPGSVLFPSEGDFPGNPGLSVAATGIAVAPGQVGTGSSAGSPVVVNYYVKDPTTITDASAATNAFTTFNGTTGEDLFGNANQSGVIAGEYGADCCFASPILGPSPARIGNGYLDVVSPNSVIIGHGRASLSDNNRTDPQALPSRYFGGGDPQADLTNRYGEKPPSQSPPAPVDQGLGRIWDPSGIAVDRQNNKLYVADDVSPADAFSQIYGSITVFNLASGEPEQYVFSSTGPLANLRGLALDPSGEFLYAASANCHVVYKMTTSLAIVGTIGNGQPCSEPSGNETFTDPEDVDVDGGHGVWVADAGSRLLYFYFYPFGP